MVAAINLARQDYEVEIWDAAKTIGQLERFHPSVHATPLDPRQVSDYIDIDITAGVVDCKRMIFYVEDQGYEMNAEHFTLVERGGRKKSLDQHLYRIALDHGIKFQFNTMVKSLDDIPERSIVATGMTKEGMGAIGVPYELGTAAYARKKLDNPKYKDICMGWAGDYTRDYGYLSTANDMMYYLVFERGPFSEDQMRRAQQHLMETEGLEFDNWELHEGVTPILGPDSLKLFKGNRILTGTISGMIEPSAMYGIHGALIAGKIAALAVTDTEKALEEFARVNRNFHRVRRLSANQRSMPMRIPFMRFMFNYPWVMFPMMRLLDDAIPGYDRHWALDMMKTRKILK
jgi:flavin-dependent dehydrogenase